MIIRTVTTASALALSIALCGVATPVWAKSCLLDTNGNGVADAATDTTGGSSSATVNTLACGEGANATGGNAVAVGANATAKRGNKRHRLRNQLNSVG